jgi:hypothetical protein
MINNRLECVKISDGFDTRCTLNNSSAQIIELSDYDIGLILQGRSLVYRTKEGSRLMITRPLERRED